MKLHGRGKKTKVTPLAGLKGSCGEVVACRGGCYLWMDLNVRKLEAREASGVSKGGGHECQPRTSANKGQLEVPVSRTPQ